MKTIDIVVSLLDPQSDHSAILEKAWKNDAEEFFLGVSMSIDETLNFNLDTVPAIAEDDGDPGQFSFNDFYVLAMKLANKEFTEESAKLAVEKAAMISNFTEWNLWYRRILLKSLPKFLPMETIVQSITRLTTG